ncbi:hypothetical protein HMPREF3227_01277 [Corynebacterium sp. CMW7794]|uniref:hypothetical protein n=1 Tax=Corynebacterium TaxID=1716 RepID=UPI00079950A4|nr:MULTISPECIES: hypothetical protein [Corynebacterium]KXI17911.1 hypothetical protein HMPREF3227_01277 [Corynebacterium sp. CMW7794]MBF9011494.1 hypothetical protein [Corynebacterium phoceense]OFN43156.1 hypothetical protein HMPREF2559_10405 [Corynebacterium sp. HMSC072G08]
MDFITHGPRATFTMDCDGYVTAQHTTQIAALHDICAHYLPELFMDSPAWKEIRSFLSQPLEGWWYVFGHSVVVPVATEDERTTFWVPGSENTVSAASDLLRGPLPAEPAWSGERLFESPLELPAAPDLDALLAAAYGYPIVLRPGHWYTDGTRPLCYIDNAAGFWSPTTKEPLVAAGIASLAPLDVPPVREPDDFLEGLSADPADHIPGSWCIAEGVADANFVFLHRADDSGITVVDIRPHAAGPRVHTLNAGRVTVSTTDRVDIP